MNDLIDRLTAAFLGHADHVDRDLFGRARDALQALVAENERLRGDFNDCYADLGDVTIKLGEAVEVMHMALKCTPSVIVPSDGGPEIVYDCGDPWELLRAILSAIGEPETTKGPRQPEG